MPNTSSYDPMIFDVMCESANRLIGEYMYLAHRNDDPAIRRALVDNVASVRAEINLVDPDNQMAVESKTESFNSRLSVLRSKRGNSIPYRKPSLPVQHVAELI
ncbi:hypothetical protein [Bifidobacterium oedipodis]|uniref:Uncharacterized protein n=1 Tax=Bifidobacterium oedipodis TaxID=2675322 RepID=A0A7Y0ERC7_9BIFI|nr:hypothetical protein [Bifidobacterium sp. DSM 109957]NMM94990.1 hypothetical protein [Bifidobacterium sp. DSM 109957]